MSYEWFEWVVFKAARRGLGPEGAAKMVLLECVDSEVDWLRLAVLLSGVTLTPGEERGLRVLLEHKITITLGVCGFRLNKDEVPPGLARLLSVHGNTFRELLVRVGEAAK